MFGTPSCIHSFEENGFNWVLDWLLAELTVMAANICIMRALSLLMKIPEQTQPQTTPASRGASRSGCMG